MLNAARAAGFRAMVFNAVVENKPRRHPPVPVHGATILATVPEAFDHPTDRLVGLHIMYLRL